MPRRTTPTRVLACMIAAGLTALGCERGPATAPISLLDLDGGQVHPLQDIHDKAVVFLFTRTDCPVSNRYAPEVRRLHEKFAKSGLAFWLVYADPDESAESIRRHLRDYDYPLPALRDPRHALVALTGVLVTPEAAVFVAGESGPTMLYRGRIDDWYADLGTMRPAPTTHDLERVLEAIAEGRPVPVRKTAAVGCFIPKLP